MEDKQKKEQAYIFGSKRLPQITLSSGRPQAMLKVWQTKGDCSDEWVGENSSGVGYRDTQRLKKIDEVYERTFYFVHF